MISRYTTAYSYPHVFLPLRCAVKVSDAVHRDRTDVESSGGG